MNTSNITEKDIATISAILDRISSESHESLAALSVLEKKLKNFNFNLKDIVVHYLNEQKSKNIEEILPSFLQGFSDIFNTTQNRKPQDNSMNEAYNKAHASRAKDYYQKDSEEKKTNSREETQYIEGFPHIRKKGYSQFHKKQVLTIDMYYYNENNQPEKMNLSYQAVSDDVIKVIEDIQDTPKNYNIRTFRIYINHVS